MISAQNRSTKMKFNLQICQITFVAELIFFIFKVSESLLEPSVRLFLYQSVCHENYANVTNCMDVKNNPAMENAIQEMSATYLMTYKILINSPALLLGLFCGAWSDHIGRKIPVMLPCMGTIIACLLYMASMIYSSLPLIMLGASIRGMFVALHSYVTDTSTREERTMRLGKLLAMNHFGYFAGSLLAGALLEVTTFDVIFCTVVFINVVAILVTIICMRESVPRYSKQEETSDCLFKCHHIEESLSVVTKKRSNVGQKKIIFYFVLVMLHQIGHNMCKSGEVDITLLFVKHKPLHWHKSWYGYLLATDYACLGFGVFVILPILSDYFHMTDLSIIKVGLFFKILRMTVMAFANQSWVVYLSVVIGAPITMIVSGCKSLLSKTVGEDEIGKTFSLLSCGETISSLVGSLVFTELYSATFHLYPGLTFCLDAILNAMVFVAIIFLQEKLRTPNASEASTPADGNNVPLAETSCLAASQHQTYVSNEIKDVHSNSKPNHEPEDNKNEPRNRTH